MDTILGASLLGFGFNILGSYDTSSATKSILTHPAELVEPIPIPIRETPSMFPRNLCVLCGE